MSTTSIFCIANSRTQAADIVDGLLSEGLSNFDISALFPDRDLSGGLSQDPHKRHLGTPSLLGGTLSWLVGIGRFVIPGVGPMIAAGPIAALVSGKSVDATNGKLAGALAHLGLPESAAKRYEKKFKAGGILLSMRAGTANEVAQAKEVFATAGAEDITASGRLSFLETADGEEEFEGHRSSPRIYLNSRH